MAVATRTLVPVIGLTDFHGQLDPTTRRWTARNVSVGGASQLATMFDEDAAQFSGDSFLFASGDNVGASPANSGLLEDMPAIDVENAWGLHATSYGNHEFDYGVARLLQHQARAALPLPGRQHRRRDDRCKTRTGCKARTSSSTATCGSA